MGLQVVGGHGRTLDKDAILAVVLLLNAAVEEEGDMSILLGLGYAKLGLAVLREILAHGVDELLRLEGDVNIGHGGVVLGHADVVNGEAPVPALEAREIVVDKGTCDLTRSVGTEVVEDDAVVLFDGVAALDDSRDHELVGNAVVVAVLNSLYRAFLINALTVDDRGIRLLDALPAVISVHGVVTTHDGGDLAYADLLAFGCSLSDIFLGGAGGNIASV